MQIVIIPENFFISIKKKAEQAIKIQQLKGNIRAEMELNNVLLKTKKYSFINILYVSKQDV